MWLEQGIDASGNCPQIIITEFSNSISIFTYLSPKDLSERSQYTTQHQTAAPAIID